MSPEPRSHEILRQHPQPLCPHFDKETRRNRQTQPAHRNDRSVPRCYLAHRSLADRRKYAQWADAYQENQVTIAYDTMWNGTESIAHKIASEIHAQSPDTVVKVFNIAKSDKNEVMTEVFKSKAIAVGSPTVGCSILSSVAGWLEFLKQLKFKNKRAAAFGCYGWSGESVKILQAKLKEAGFDVIDDNIRSQWNPEESDYAAVPELVKHLLG